VVKIAKNAYINVNIKLKSNLFQCWPVGVFYSHLCVIFSQCAASFSMPSSIFKQNPLLSFLFFLKNLILRFHSLCWYNWTAAEKSGLNCVFFSSPLCCL